MTAKEQYKKETKLDPLIEDRENDCFYHAADYVHWLEYKIKELEIKRRSDMRSAWDGGRSYQAWSNGTAGIFGVEEPETFEEWIAKQS